MDVFSVDLNTVSGDELLTGIGVVGRVGAVLGKANALWNSPAKVCIEVKVLAEVCRPRLNYHVSFCAEGEQSVVGVNANSVTAHSDWGRGCCHHCSRTNVSVNSSRIDICCRARANHIVA